MVFGSANGAYAFKTRPPQLATWSGKSQGTLFGRPRRHRDRDVDPGAGEHSRDAFVADDGKHVVTFDTWARLGYEHALVIYGEQGAVVADYDLDALLSARRNRHLSGRRPSAPGAGCRMRRLPFDDRAE